MNIHLPGHGGFIRSWLQQSLFERGHQEASGFYDADLIIDARGPSRPQDFIDGLFSVGSLMKRFVQSLETNLDAKRPFILISSLDVEINNNPYTALKLSQEAALRAYATCFNFRDTIIRTSCVFGPGMDPRRFIPLAARRILAGEPVPIHISREGFASRRQWTYAPALTDWIMDSIAGSTIKATSYVNWTMNSLSMAKEIAQVLKKPLITQEIPFYENNPGHFEAPLREALLTPPLLSLDVALRRTLYSLNLLG